MTDSEVDRPPTSFLWEDDLLDRGQYAKFLTKYIDTKCESSKPGMVMALDAAWGYGKTFFVQHWARELSNLNHHAVVFDAWKNDLADDPVISFMAELRNGLTPLHEALPANRKLKKSIGEKINATTTNLRKAVFPASKVIAKALFKKTVGIGIDEIQNSIDEAPDLTEIAETSNEVVDAGLDEFFKRSLKSHDDRIQSIQKFQESLEELLDTLRSAKIIDGPMYVFIDELDRCRPDYAIRLLEGVKHIFNVKGVAFIVSTNLQQLSKAVGAVYGVNFDGHQYLKRFFDFEYNLPKPTRLNFIRSISTQNRIIEWEKYSGLDERISSPTPAERHIRAFSIVAEAMELDLRSTQRALTIVDAAVSQMPTSQPVLSIWMFFLAAVKIQDEDAFRAFANGVGADRFTELCARVLKNKQTLDTLEDFQDPQGYTRTRQTTVQLAVALRTMYNASIQKGWLKEKVRDRLNQTDYSSHLISNMRTWIAWNQEEIHPISEYVDLISMAGHVSL